MKVQSESGEKSSQLIFQFKPLEKSICLKISGFQEALIFFFFFIFPPGYFHFHQSPVCHYSTKACRDVFGFGPGGVKNVLNLFPD